MRRPHPASRILFVAGALLFAGSAARGDTIVLKNGRRILALSVVEEGDRVKYETSAGQLSLPKSIVDHIEKGGAVPDSPGAAAANLAISPPAIEISDANTEVERGAVHDGAIDRDFIAKLEGEARSGSRQANAIAAQAHHAAAQFEASHGDMEHALADENSALIYAPDQPDLLMNVAYLHLRRSEFKQSLDFLERARRVAPNNPDVPKLAGWAYYGMNKLDQAVAEWRRALALRPDREVRAALSKAQRDKQEEENYRENESTHFTLRYSGEAEPGLAHDVLRTLEGHFSAIESELSFTPPDSIGIILYTQQAFADITRAPGWVGALNDGRSRVPWQGLPSRTAEHSRVLKHELTHSFVQQKTRGRAPTWIQEGLAQWMEGRRSDSSATALLAIFRSNPELTATHYEGNWMKLSNGDAAMAYAWSLANIEFIIRSDGSTDMDRILSRLAEGDTPEAALRAVLHSNYAELTHDTVEYLKKSYSN